MQIRLMGPAPQLTTPPTIRQIAYGDVVAETQLTLAVSPAAPTNILTPQLYFSFWFVIRNSSPAAQQIRVGYQPSFVAPVRGVLLMPGDFLGGENFNSSLNALTDAAGGLLDVYILRTTPS